MTDVGIQKFVDGANSSASNKVFTTDMRETLFQVNKKLNLAISSRRKVRQAALGRKDAVLRAIPEQKRLAQAGPSCHQRPGRVRLQNSRVQHGQVLCGKLVQAPCRGDDIIEQYDVFRIHVEPPRQFRRTQRPGQIVGVQLTLDHRSRHAKPHPADSVTGGVGDMLGGLLTKMFDHIFESGKVTGGVAALENRLQCGSACFLKHRQVALGAANVSCQNHGRELIWARRGLWLARIPATTALSAGRVRSQERSAEEIIAGSAARETCRRSKSRLAGNSLSDSNIVATKRVPHLTSTGPSPSLPREIGQAFFSSPPNCKAIHSEFLRAMLPSTAALGLIVLRCVTRSTATIPNFGS